MSYIIYSCWFLRYEAVCKVYVSWTDSKQNSVFQWTVNQFLSVKTNVQLAYTNKKMTAKNNYCGTVFLLDQNLIIYDGIKYVISVIVKKIKYKL